MLNKINFAQSTPVGTASWNIIQLTEKEKPLKFFIVQIGSKKEKQTLFKKKTATFEKKKKNVAV